MKIQVGRVKLVLEWDEDEDDDVNEEVVWVKNSGAEEKAEAVAKIAKPHTGLYL